jgi:hypothetical protein
MLIADAVPAIVLMNPPGPSAEPVISGNVYVSAGWSVLAFTIKFWLPAESATVTKLTLIVAADALKFVAVNLSISVVTPLAVY